MMSTEELIPDMTTEAEEIFNQYKSGHSRPYDCAKEIALHYISFFQQKEEELEKAKEELREVKEELEKWEQAWQLMCAEFGGGAGEMVAKEVTDGRHEPEYFGAFVKNLHDTLQEIAGKLTPNEKKGKTLSEAVKQVAADNRERKYRIEELKVELQETRESRLRLATAIVKWRQLSAAKTIEALKEAEKIVETMEASLLEKKEE